MLEIPPCPVRIVLGVTWAVLSGGNRNLRKDALSCTRRLRIKVLGREYIPRTPPGVVVVNHYYRPGFAGVWIALTLSAVIPEELVWVMAAAWTEGNTIGSRLREAASVLLFPRLVRVYHLISMPPMPPRPHETAARARAVRQILATARQVPAPFLAITPEGQDSPEGGLRRPPAGVGRMLYKLAQTGCRFYPVGLYEQDQEIITRFGPSFELILPQGVSSDEIDRRAAGQVMNAIAANLPPGLRGEYTGGDTAGIQAGEA